MSKSAVELGVEVEHPTLPQSALPRRIGANDPFESVYPRSTPWVQQIAVPHHETASLPAFEGILRVPRRSPPLLIKGCLGRVTGRQDVDPSCSALPEAITGPLLTRISTFYTLEERSVGH